MEITRTPLRDVEQTIAAMIKVIYSCSSDCSKYASWSPERFYNLVRDIPYRADPKGNEHLQRPSVTLNGWSPWNDCDDLAIVMCSYAREAGVPWRLAIGGSVARVHPITKAAMVPFHHVWPEFKLNGRWVPMDATYPRYMPYVDNQHYLKIKVFLPKPR